jgi:NADH:quinone reductase (non-electrogenic)
MRGIGRRRQWPEAQDRVPPEEAAAERRDRDDRGEEVGHHVGVADDATPIRRRPRVVVVGGGFGGLLCAKALRGEPVDVLLVDEHDYHLFTPLLYQVASCLLNPSEIAAPLRKVFRGAPNLRFRQGEVVHVDLEAKQLTLADSARLDYDFCVIATGSVTNYYDNDEVGKHAFGLKDLGEALELRNHVLECFERATTALDPTERERHLTFCIVGAGPTGVEYAGALAEFVRLVVPAEYPELESSSVRVILLEGGDRVLPTFKPRLSVYAHGELERRGVDVRLGTLVQSADAAHVVLDDGSEVPTSTMVWTAGVRPANVIDESRRRIHVDDHFRVAGARDAYAIGDVAAGFGPHGEILPMVSPAAMQAGRYVAREIVRGRSRRPFRYRDKGTLATIGRTSAVGQVGPVSFTGFTGWVVWLVVHLYYLIGFENRLRVLLRWAWYYVHLDRPVRMVFRADDRDRG